MIPTKPTLLDVLEWYDADDASLYTYTTLYPQYRRDLIAYHVASEIMNFTQPLIRPDKDFLVQEGRRIMKEALQRWQQEETDENA